MTGGTVGRLAMIVEDEDCVDHTACCVTRLDAVGLNGHSLCSDSRVATSTAGVPSFT